MSIDHPDRGQRYAAPALDAGLREMRWLLQQILIGLGMREGGFRAATGQWPSQLSGEELHAWLDWFHADPEGLPPIPLNPAFQSSDGAGDSHQVFPRAEHMPGRRPAPGGARPVQSPRRAPPEEAPDTGNSAPRTAAARSPRDARPEEEPDTGNSTLDAAGSESGQARLTAEEITFLDELRRGTSVQKAAQAAGVTTHTFYQRRKRNAAFDRAWQEALAARGAQEDS